VSRLARDLKTIVDAAKQRLKVRLEKRAWKTGTSWLHSEAATCPCLPLGGKLAEVIAPTLGR
jgi:hypothetical protein